MNAKPDSSPTETTAVSPEVPRRRLWLAILVLLLPLGSLLWVSNWFYQRSRLFTDTHVVLGEPALPWGKLIGDKNARELFGIPVELNSHENELTPYQIGIIGGYSPLKSLQLRGVTDADVRRLRGLTNLERLTLYESPISDEACETIGRLDNLQYLSLGDCYADSTTVQITDQGLSHLVGLTQLRGLELAAPGVTHDGLKSIARLQTLEALMLDGTSLSGEGLSDLPKLQNLHMLMISNWSLKEHALSDLPKLGNFRSLALWNCSLSENCLRPLEECALLSRISLEGSRFTDDVSLRPLRECSLLTDVHLERSDVTDAMLDDLTSIRSLSALYLNGTKVSREASERFHLSRPEVFLVGASGRRVSSQPDDQ